MANRLTPKTVAQDEENLIVSLTLETFARMRMKDRLPWW
jgi:hypothetical protein